MFKKEKKQNKLKTFSTIHIYENEETNDGGGEAEMSLGSRLILSADADGSSKSRNAWGLAGTCPLRDGRGHPQDSAKLNVFCPGADAGEPRKNRGNSSFVSFPSDEVF